MAEKGELPTDQVSLPPTYAPSEVYTESPPPAYKRDGTANIRIAKIICITLLLMTFMVGSFIVVHRWVHLKECHCPDIAIKSEDVLGRPEFLVAEEPQAKSLNSIEGVNEEPIKENVVIEEIKENNEENKEKQEEAKPINDETIVEEIKKNIKLPLDMIMGNPSLGGKDMNCNVEKRKQKIADGIFSEAVIVTCDNEEKVDLPFPPKMDLPFAHKMEIKKGGVPPISLLSHIMKALLTRPKMNNEPKIIRPLFPRPPSSEESPFIPNSGEQLPMNNGFLRIVPIKKVVHRINPIPEIRELNMPKQFNFPHPLLNPMVRKIILKPQNLQEQEHNDNEIPPFMRPAPEGVRLPFEPESSNSSPIRIMRINGNDLNEEENSGRPPFPFPFNPLMKIFPIRRARVLHVMPRPNIENHQEESETFEPEQRPPFPHFEENHGHGIPEVPEASGRSLPSPRIAVPGGPEIKFIRLANPSPLLRLPGRGVVTHMEMRAPPQHHTEDEEYPPVLPVNNEEQEFGPPKTHTVIEHQEPLYRPEIPPHFEIKENFQEPEDNEHQFSNFQNVSPEEEPISIPQIQQRFFLPPPPRFRPEGRISPVAQINPDADIYTGPNNDH